MKIFQYARSKRSSATLENDKKVIKRSVASLRDNDTMSVRLGTDLKSEIMRENPNSSVNTDIFRRIINVTHNVSKLSRYLDRDSNDDLLLMLENKLTDPLVETVFDYVLEQLNQLDGRDVYVAKLALDNIYEGTDNEALAWAMICRNMSLEQVDEAGSEAGGNINMDIEANVNANNGHEANTDVNMNTDNNTI